MNNTPARELITGAEFARRVNADRSAITRAVQRGRIKYYRNTKRFDWKTQEREWYENTTQPVHTEAVIAEKKAGRNGNPAGPEWNHEDGEENDEENHEGNEDKTYTYWKSKREKEAYLKIRRENEEAQKELIPRRIINMVLFPFIRSIREAITSIPDRCGASLAADIRALMPDSVKVDQDTIIRTTHLALEQELRNILNEVAHAKNWYDEIPESD